MGTAAATHVMAPVRMPDPPMPVIALAAMSVEELCARPATKDPIMNTTMKAMIVGFSENKWKSFAATGDIAQLCEISILAGVAGGAVRDTQNEGSVYLVMR